MKKEWPLRTAFIFLASSFIFLSSGCAHEANALRIGGGQKTDVPGIIRESGSMLGGAWDRVKGK